MIEAIFYARFLPDEGTRVIYQNPPGSIIPDPDNPQIKPLVDFEAISEFVIPKQAFCNRLVTEYDPNEEHPVIGFPVCLKNRIYDRNEFIFNFGLVLRKDISPADTIKYEVIIKRLAEYFTELEVQNQFLSQSPSRPVKGRTSIPALLETIREDLNNYSECMIPVDSANTINLKLFPTYSAPPSVKSWHVPILQVKLDGLISEDWDLTMKKIIPFINGVNDIRRISQLSDTSPSLTKIAIQHLLMYRSVTLVDKFFFGNTYILQPLQFEDFLENVDGVQDECARYVSPAGKIATGALLCQIYARMQCGHTVKELIRQGIDLEANILQLIDPRRLVQFGVTKSFLRRVHKYPVFSRYIMSLAPKPSSTTPSSQATSRSIPSGKTSSQQQTTNVSPQPLVRRVPLPDGIKEADAELAEALKRYTDGCHCMDQIITETGLPESEITKRLHVLSKIYTGVSWEIQILYR